LRIFIHQNQPVAKVIKKYLTNNTEKKQSVHSNCKVPM